MHYAPARIVTQNHSASGGVAYLGNQPGGATRPHPRRWEAYALLGSGVLSVAGLLLYHHGKTGAATALGVFGALGAAMLGALRILTEPSE